MMLFSVQLFDLSFFIISLFDLLFIIFGPLHALAYDHPPLPTLKIHPKHTLCQQILL